MQESEGLKGGKEGRREGKDRKNEYQWRNGNTQK